MSIAQNFPEIKPSLDLSFALTKKLDPRVTFARASGATYYGTETSKAEENLFLYSQEFDNAAWTKDGATVSTGVTAPDGTSTAQTLVGNGANSRHETLQLLGIATVTGVYSVFAKANGVDFIQLSTGIGTDGRANFDISTGVVGSFDGAFSNLDITDVGNGWYRCSAKVAATATARRISLVSSSTAARLESWTTSGGVDLWGAQFEVREDLTAYTPTTDQPITRYQPVLETVTDNVARFDHDPVTGESLGLLVEEQRTNLFTASESFTTGWTKEQLSVVTNTAIAPDGTLTAAKAVPTTDVQVHVVRQSSPTGNPQALSIYAKEGEYSTLALFFTNHDAYVVFNLSTGTIVETSGTVTGQITDVGNGFYRCSASTTLTTAAQVRYYVINGSSWADRTVAGDGFSGIYIWGAQLEAAAFPTSYVKTEASQVTRSADAASMTGANFSSWYRQDEGTVYLEASTPSENLTFFSEYLAISDGTESNRHIITQPSSSFAVRAITNTNGTQVSSLQPLTASINQPFKFVYAYKTNDFAAVGSGGSALVDNSGNLPVVNKIGISQSSTGSIRTRYIRKLSFYPKRLTNAQLQALTG